MPPIKSNPFFTEPAKSSSGEATVIASGFVLISSNLFVHEFNIVTKKVTNNNLYENVIFFIFIFLKP